jgi:serine/threonine protein phosphatase 1
MNNSSLDSSICQDYFPVRVKFLQKPGIPRYLCHIILSTTPLHLGEIRAGILKEAESFFCDLPLTASRQPPDLFKEYSKMPPRHFVIPDIHGCAVTFRTLVEDVICLTTEDQLYLLGDYIDRGPRNKEVLDTIIGLARGGYSVKTLRGNHEEMLLNSENSPADFRLWTLNGGNATLYSFGVDSAGEIPRRYLKFLEKLPLFFILDDFILVHACLNFDSPDPFSDRESMLWARHCEVDRSRIGNRRVISGHTPVNREALEKGLDSSRIMLDNGCVYKGYTGLGALAALELNSMALFFQENID